MRLIDKYGYCVIPKGTILLRSGKNEGFIDCMYFGLDDLVGGNSRRGEIQVWQVLYDLTLLFMVSHVTRRAWVISSIVEIYQSEYPEERNINDLDIKQRDLTKRKKLIDLLKKEEIIGWLSSLEDNPALEICLFPDEKRFSNLISPLRAVDPSDFEFHNALNDLRIYPSVQFYERSKKHCDSYKEYEKRHWLNHHEYGHDDPDQVRRKYLDLRTKLKI